MDKTLGGTCVNVGCIPSKALLTSSEHYEFAKHAAAAHGIGVGQLTLDLATMLKRKDEVVGQNTKGVEFLFRKNKITWAKGRGTLEAGNIVRCDAVGDAGGPPAEKIATYQAKTSSLPPAPYRSSSPSSSSTKSASSRTSAPSSSPRSRST